MVIQKSGDDVTPKTDRYFDLQQMLRVKRQTPRKLRRRDRPMRAEEKTIPGSSSCVSVLEVSLPNDEERANKRDIQHPQSSYLRMGNSHHIHVALLHVTRFVERFHHAEILEHDENISNAPSG